MNNSSSNLYNVGLLDDLHKYFPDLLYNPTRFHNIQDVLSYIQTQTRSRFNLYDYGLAQQQGSRQNVVIQPPVEPLIVTPTTPTIPTTHHSNCTCRDCMPLRTPLRTQHRTTTTPPPAPRRLPIINPISTYVNYSSAFEPDFLDSANLLTSLLNLTNMPGLQTIPLGATFLNAMENVIVRPTEAQIGAATTVFNMPSIPDISDTTCTVCQDTMETNVPVRRINTCRHQFHKSCIDTWFERSVRCPVCRSDIRESSSTE